MPILRLPPEWQIGNLPEVDSRKLPSGSLGNLQTVEKMRQVARSRAGHPLIRRLAISILQGAQVPSMHYLTEAKAIGQYVQDRVQYGMDATGFEQVHDPLYMVEEIQAGRARFDCDDQALLAATLLLSVGHDPFFRVVRYSSWFGPYNHIYVVDYVKNLGKPETRFVIDPIIKWKPIGFEVPHKSGKEIRVAG
jgi:hypothetical protein